MVLKKGKLGEPGILILKLRHLLHLRIHENKEPVGL